MSTDTIISVDSLVKRFNQETVIDGVSFSANKGDIISVLGASGSGKSTLLRCINFLEKPNGGRIHICGEEIKMAAAANGDCHPVDPAQLRRVRTKVGMVFQHFNLWAHMTALENVMEAPWQVLKKSKAEAHRLATDILEKVGLADRVNHFPAQLSGGQQQRVGIARAMAMEPQAILFDEPTSALDPELVGEVLQVMQTLAAEQVTMIVVTHEIKFARDLSTRVIFLDQGKICVEGAPTILDGPENPRLKQFLAGTTTR